MARFDMLDQIQRLDPERDHQRIVHLSFGYEFCWDSIRALEIALYRTYCVPSISALLDRSGEFHNNAQRRYNDTSILVAEMCEWGYELRRSMNRQYVQSLPSRRFPRKKTCLFRLLPRLHESQARRKRF